MNYHVLTLFPEMIENGMNTSITGRAITKGLLSLEAINIRDFAFNKHQKVDDYPYGGGAGMLMQAEPVYLSYESIAERIGRKPRVIFLTPQGKTFNQDMAKEFALEEDLVFLCILVLSVYPVGGDLIAHMLQHDRDCAMLDTCVYRYLPVRLT